MALITVSGFPCCGKSTCVGQLETYFKNKISESSYGGPIRKVLILSDDTLNIERSVYDDGQSEKLARATLFSALKRCLATDTILILDGMNYIKGFRYQLYCAVREAKLRCCTLYIVASQDLCISWNAMRPPDHSYAPETLKNLILRHEEPSSMVRWDSPLFTVTWSDYDVPYEEMWQAITIGILKRPNVATVAVAHAPTNALHNLESTTTNIVSALSTLQTTSGLPGVGTTLKLTVTEKLYASIRVPQRIITMAELQRAKRQFVILHKKAVVLGSTEKGDMDWSEEKIAEKFARYLEEFINRTK